jgi:hypothetical protein
MNTKLKFCIIEQLLGLKIKFHKNEIICFVRKMMKSTSTSRFFYAGLDLCLSDTLRYLLIIKNFVTTCGFKWRVALDEI